MPEPADLDTTDHGERDAASIRILGFFFTVLGLLVVVGTFFTLNDENSSAAPTTEQAAAEIDSSDQTSSQQDESTAAEASSTSTHRGAIVNAVSGIVLTLVGVGMLWWTRRTSQNPAATE